jgi:hypothetical protein
MKRCAGFDVRLVAQPTTQQQESERGNIGRECAMATNKFDLLHLAIMLDGGGG